MKRNLKMYALSMEVETSRATAMANDKAIAKTITAQMIRTQYGGLEQMRAELGFSRRQACEHLLVDPSAWSRWTANGQESAPPRIYKALALLIEQKRAGAQAAVKSKSLPDQEAADLGRDVDRAVKVSLGWKLVLILNTIAIIYLFLNRSF